MNVVKLKGFSKNTLDKRVSKFQEEYPDIKLHITDMPHGDIMVILNGIYVPDLKLGKVNEYMDAAVAKFVDNTSYSEFIEKGEKRQYIRVLFLGNREEIF